GRDALDPPEKLSIEHSIPDALGGTLATATLVCTDCNNNMGAKIDSHLATRFDAEEFLAGLSGEPQRAWITVGDKGRVRADLVIEKGDKPSIRVYFDERRSPKGHFAEACQAL